MWAQAKIHPEQRGPDERLLVSRAGVVTLAENADDNVRRVRTAEEADGPDDQRPPKRRGILLRTEYEATFS